jgi:hypothetical protein
MARRAPGGFEGVTRKGFLAQILQGFNPKSLSCRLKRPHRDDASRRLLDPVCLACLPFRIKS